MSQVLANYQVNGNFPVTVGGTGTAIKYFPAPSRNFTAGAGLTPSSTNANGQLNVPGNNRLNAQWFEVVAAGNFEVGAGGACPSVTIGVYAQTSAILTSPSYTLLATTGAITTQNLDGVFYPWVIQMQLEGDSGSGLLQGRFSSIVNNVNTSTQNIPLSSNLSGLNFAAEPVFGLVVGVTFSVSEAGNSANMYEFQLSQ